MKNDRDEYEDLDLPETNYDDIIDGLPEDNALDEDSELFDELSASLRAQVNEELGTEDAPESLDEHKPPKKKRRFLFLKVMGIIVGVLVLTALWLVFTPSGRRVGTRIAAKFIHSSMDVVEPEATPTEAIEITTTDAPKEPTNVYNDIYSHRYEDYVTNFLIFGIEEIGGGSNTDAMMLISLNTKDNTIKLTSFLRDTYVTIPGHGRNKLNSTYVQGGVDLLVDVLENTYDFEIEGYACVNFSSFEGIIDRLGGIDLELGEAEAKYLRRTNYISKPENRTVQAGWNHMNGNQVMGYCRVRKVATLGGANNDYGRTVRQRRVIKAIIDQFKSSSYLDMLSIAEDCLGYLKTNITEDQIADALLKVIENGMYETESMRLPADNYFRDSGRAGINGITYALVIDDYRQENIDVFHQFLFLDPTPTPSPTPTEPGAATTITPSAVTP